MRKVISVLVIGFLFLGLSSPISNAGLFGKTQCEKVKAQISREDEIGRNLWKILDSNWKTKNLSSTNANNLSLLLSEEDLWNQYAKIFKIGIDNSSCFSSKEAAEMIAGRTGSLKAVRNLKEWETSRNWGSFATKHPFPKYLSFKEMFPVN